MRLPAAQVWVRMQLNRFDLYQGLRCVVFDSGGEVGTAGASCGRVAERRETKMSVHPFCCAVILACDAHSRTVLLF